MALSGTIPVGGTLNLVRDLSGLGDGTVTASATLTDAAGNVSTTGTDTAAKDTINPTVTSVTSSNPDGVYVLGDVISVQVLFSEPVVVTGTPQLALNSGGTASYVSGSGTGTLTFTYTVGTGDSSPDLDYVSTTALTLAGGSIRDNASNDAN